MAADPNSGASRVLAALSLAAAAYLSALLCGYYLQLWGVKRHHLESASFILIAFSIASVVARAKTNESPTAGPPLPLSVVVLAVVVLASAIYWPIVSAGLFADDYVLIQAAREGRYTVWTELFRPAVFVLWGSIDRLTSHVPSALHAINIACHLLNGVMVAGLGRRLDLSDRASALAGAFFVCFPASVEAVAWPSGIQDVLMTTFVLGFLLVALRSPVTPQRVAAGVVLLLAALLTKETAVVTPALAVLFFAALQLPRKNWIHAAAAIAAVSAFVLIRFVLLPLPADYLGAFDRYRVKEILVRPFASLSVPLREIETAEFPILALILTLVIVVAVSAAASRWSRRDRRFHIAIALVLFVLVSIAPVHAYISVTADLHGSRYLYLGSVAWSLLLVMFAQSGFAIQTIARSIVTGAILIIWTVFACRHATIWRDAAATRDRIIASAQQIPSGTCAAWAVYDLPAVVDGVPVFVNGFPEAMSTAGRKERFHVAPATLEPGECRARWSGSAFVVAN